MSSSSDLIAAVERSGNRTWPAMEEELFDGWLLRFAAGVTRRANSVTVYRPSALAVDEKIDAVESWYGIRNRPTIFRTTPLTDREVHRHLDRRGYDDVEGALVLGLSLTQVSGGPPPEATGAPTEDWWAVFDSDRPVPVDRPVLETMWADRPTGFIVGRDGRRPVAVGSVTVDGLFAGIFNMRTVPTARRGGHRRAVLRAALRWAKSQGAGYAYLQVVEDNHAARRLYAAVGFTPLYEYRYRTQAGVYTEGP